MVITNINRLEKVSKEEISSGKYIVPDGVTHLGREVFRNIKELAEVVLPDSLEEIGLRAFAGCTGLRKVTIPNKVVKLANGAFAGCVNLEKLNIPGKVKRIGSSMFFGCLKLKRITIPASVEFLDSSAFDFCAGLKELVILRQDGAHVLKDPLVAMNFIAFSTKSQAYVSGVTVHAALRFDGIRYGGRLVMRDCFVAEQDGKYAYGRTRKLARAELAFDRVRGLGAERYRGVSPEEKMPFEEMIAMYRAVGGVYLPDSAQFIDKKKWPAGTYDAYQMAELSQGECGSDKFARFFGIRQNIPVLCPLQ